MPITATAVEPEWEDYSDSLGVPVSGGNSESSPAVLLPSIFHSATDSLGGDEGYLSNQGINPVRLLPKLGW